MADNEITAWVRLRNINRFVRDAKRAEDAIDDLGDAARDGEGPFNQLGGALSNLNDMMPSLFGRTRIFGFAVGTVITALVGSIPLVVGLGGSLTALTGSLGAAALGAGSLGVALVAMAAPLGVFGLVAAQAFQGFSKVNTAMDQWRVQVAAYGRNSTQAETALARLNGIVENFGGQTILRAVQGWKRLTAAFAEATRGAMTDVYLIFIDFTRTVREMLPMLGSVAKTVSGALRGAFAQLFSVMRSADFGIMLQMLADNFARLSGPLMTAAINFLMGFFRIATRLGPTLDWVIGGVVKMSQAFRGWAGGGDLGALVEHFKSWWALLRAVGGLLVTILSGGASTGKSLVDTLTNIVNRWNEWLNTGPGQSSMKKFFVDAANMTKAFVSVLAGMVKWIFKFGKALMPIYTTVFKALISGVHDVRDALKPMQPFLDNILLPLLKGLAKGVIGGVVAAFKVLVFVLKILASVLGWIGDKVGPGLKPVFETLGHVIGFIFSGAILKVLGNIGKLSVLLGPLGKFFQLLAVPIRMVGAAVGWLVGKFGGLIKAVGSILGRLFPVFQRAFDKIIGFLTNPGGIGSKLFDAGVKIWNKVKDGIFQAIGTGLAFAGDIAKSVANAVIKLLNTAIPNKIPLPGPAPDIDLPNNPIPMLAQGGVVSGVGSWITGESGPELNTLRSGKVTVVPLTPSVAAQGTTATLATDERRVIVTKVYLRGRQIAEAVADEAEDEAARM